MAGLFQTGWVVAASVEKILRKAGRLQRALGSHGEYRKVAGRRERVPKAAWRIAAVVETEEKRGALSKRPLLLWRAPKIPNKSGNVFKNS